MGLRLRKTSLPFCSSLKDPRTYQKMGAIRVRALRSHRMNLPRDVLCNSRQTAYLEV